MAKTGPDASPIGTDLVAYHMENGFRFDVGTHVSIKDTIVNVP